MRSEFRLWFVALFTSLFLARPGMADDPAPTAKAQALVEIDAPAAAVWAAVDEFDEMHLWHPLVIGLQILRGDGDSAGTIRQLRYRSGATVHQELLRVDPVQMRKEWRMVGWTDLPFDDYTSSLSVIEVTPALTMVVWQSRFTPKQWRIDGRDAEFAGKLVEEMYRIGLQRLKSQLEAR